MSRDSGGTYVLPAGNPVTPDTIIESAWANTTMPDLGNEITNSLDRQGRGGMLAPLKIFDGNVSAPGLGFTQDPNNGLARLGTDQWVLVAGGVAVATLTPTMVTIPNLTSASLDARYLLKSGGTLTGALTIATGASPQLVTKRADDTAGTNYISGVNSTGTPSWSLGNIGTNDNVYLRSQIAGTLLVLGSSPAQIIVDGNGTGTVAITGGTSVTGSVNVSGQVNAVGFTPGAQTLAGTGSISVSWSAGSVALCPLTGPLTISSVVNVPVGTILRIGFSNTAAGAVSWPGNVIWPTPGTAPDLAAGAQKRAVVTLFNDSSVYLGNVSVY